MHRTIYCDDADMWQQAKKLAKRQGRSLSGVIMSLLADWLVVPNIDAVGDADEATYARCVGMGRMLTGFHERQLQVLRERTAHQRETVEYWEQFTAEEPSWESRRRARRERTALSLLEMDTREAMRLVDRARGLEPECPEGCNKCAS